MAQRGKKQSPFIGRRVPLVDNGVPILYPRYNDISEILVGAGSKRGADADTDVEQQLKKHKADDQQDQQQTEEANGNAAAPAETEKERKKREKKEKKEARKKQQQQDGDAMDVDAPTEQQHAADAPTHQQQQEQQEQQLDKTSGRSNAEEAAKMRSVLGFQGSAVKPGQFGFGFTLQQQKDAELKAKLERLQAQDATPDGYVPRRVYVGGMPYSWDESTVREYWGYCGDIEAVDLLTFPDSGRFRGIAFVTFAGEQGYEAALACDGEELEGHTLKVQKCKAAAAMKAFEEVNRAQQRQQQQQQQQNGQDALGAAAAVGSGAKPKRGAAAATKTEGYNVAYVGNVAFEATPDDLMKLFKPYGCSKVRLHTDKDSGRSKGFAHVHFESEEGLDRAMELNGHQLLRRFLKVGYAQPKKEQ